MGKKLIGIAVIAIMLFGVFGLVACTPEEDEMTKWIMLERSTCCTEQEPSSAYATNINSSTMAYEEAIVHFTTLDGKYTDDFGGVFVDKNGIHNICVVGTHKPVESDYLIYKQVRNSYNFLESIVGEVGRVSQEFSVCTASLCESCNSVVVGISVESNIPLLVANLEAKDLFSKGTLKFYVDENGIIPN